MAQLVFLLIFLGAIIVLIVAGTRLNVYLFSSGVLGSSQYSRVKSLKALAATKHLTAEERFYNNIGKEEDESARYARSVMAIISVVLIIAMFVAVSFLATAL
jgi:hypothetical protein